MRDKILLIDFNRFFSNNVKFLHFKRRELHDPDTDVVLQAVTSISDLVHDPEKGYEAITLRIPDR